MTHKDKHDDEFDTYLKGESSISTQYDALDDTMPSHEIDQKIRAAAREAIKKQPRVATSPFSSNWGVPVSLAAVLVLSISLITLLPDNQITMPTPEPVLKATPSTPSASEDHLTEREARDATMAASPAPAAKLKPTAEKIAPISADANNTAAIKPADSVEIQPARSGLPNRQRLLEENDNSSQSQRRKIEETALPEIMEKKSVLQQEEPKDQAGLLRGLNSRSAGIEKSTPDGGVKPPPSLWLQHIQRLRLENDIQNANSSMDQFLAFYVGDTTTPKHDMLALLGKADRDALLSALNDLRRIDDVERLSRLFQRTLPER